MWSARTVSSVTRSTEGRLDRAAGESWATTAWAPKKARARMTASAQEVRALAPWRRSIIALLVCLMSCDVGEHFLDRGRLRVRRIGFEVTFEFGARRRHVTTPQIDVGEFEARARHPCRVKRIGFF